MGATKPFLHELVSDLDQLMNEAYPLLNEKKEHITQTIKNEEIKFFETIDKGINILEEAISKDRKSVV